MEPSPSPSPTSPPARANLGAVDLLRAFAAWSVVAWHLADHLGYPMPLFNSGAWAVDLFMNASGFLMLYHYILREGKEPWNSALTWKIFYTRRWFRIVPLYGFLVLLVAFFPPMQHFLDCDTLGQRIVYVFERLTFVFGFIPSRATFGPFPDWSLALEMQFYVFFPFLALLMRRWGPGKFFFAACVVAAAACRVISYYDVGPAQGLIHFPQPTLLPLKIHIFAVGMVLASVYFQGASVLRSWWFVAALPFYALASPYGYTKLLGAIYILLGFILFLLPQLPAGVEKTWNYLLSSLNRFSSIKPIHLLAEGSYSVYLTHGFLFWFVAFSPVAPRTLTSTLSFIATLLISFSILNIVSYLLFSFVECPGIGSGKRSVRKIGG